jgi:hypothetical protein
MPWFSPPAARCESSRDEPHLKDIRDFLPDVRDGLTRQERVVLWVLHETQKERGGQNVPTAMLWGRVCEHISISPEELSAMLARLGARKDLPPVNGIDPGSVL